MVSVSVYHSSPSDMGVPLPIASVAGINDENRQEKQRSHAIGLPNNVTIAIPVEPDRSLARRNWQRATTIHSISIHSAVDMFYDVKFNRLLGPFVFFDSFWFVIFSRCLGTLAENRNCVNAGSTERFLPAVCS